MSMRCNRRQLRVVLVTAALVSGLTHQASAGNAERGRQLARQNCSVCHAIDRASPSRLTLAPPFRDLHRRYPVDDLAEALAEGISTGHPTMPEFRFDPGQIDDFITFLKTLERRR
jgi:cytochrome c